MLPFTPALAAYSAEQFVDEILLGRFRMHELLIGHDHGFGHDRAGDVEHHAALGAERGFGVSVVPAVTVEWRTARFVDRDPARGGRRRPRWRVRGLGRHYSLSGTRGQGARRGRLLGFPDHQRAGAESPRKLLPPEGVYAVRVQTPMGRTTAC